MKIPGLKKINFRTLSLLAAKKKVSLEMEINSENSSLSGPSVNCLNYNNYLQVIIHVSFFAQLLR